MTDQHGSDQQDLDQQHSQQGDAQLPPEADPTLLERSQATIDEAKRDAQIGVEPSEDERLAEEGVPVPGDTAPADGPAPAA